MSFILIEKKALLSITVIIAVFSVSFFVIGQKNLWFEKKAHYHTIISDAEGLREGSQVTLNGLRIGSVTKLEVDENNKIQVYFSVTESLREKIRKNSIARVIRAMIIGDKRIDLIPGTKEFEVVAENGFVEGKDSHEIADLISGKNLSAITDQLKGVTQGVSKLSETMNLVMEKVKPKDIARTYELMIPTVKNLHYITNDLKGLVRSAKNDLFDNRLTYKTLRNFNDTLVPFAKRQKLLNQILDNMGLLSQELADNPQFAKQILGTLQEMIVTLKAIQKTWLLKGHVKEIRQKDKK